MRVPAYAMILGLLSASFGQAPAVQAQGDLGSQADGVPSHQTSEQREARQLNPEQVARLLELSAAFDRIYIPALALTKQQI